MRLLATWRLIEKPSVVDIVAMVFAPAEPLLRELVSPDDVMVMDRNFCVQSHLASIEDRSI